MRVKNMGRKQQKAVFASIGNKGVSAGSNTQQRREELLKNDMSYKQLKKRSFFISRLLVIFGLVRKLNICCFFLFSGGQKKSG